MKMPNSAAYDRAFVDWQQTHPYCTREDCHKAGIEAERIAVFGHGYKLDAEGRPYNESIGSRLNQTQQSIDSYVTAQGRRIAGVEKGFKENLARMEAEKVETDKRRAAAEAQRTKSWATEIMPDLPKGPFDRDGNSTKTDF
jgi:hypothetical protein